MPKQGLATKVHNRTVFEIATEALKLARAGLARRQRLDAGGRDEARYLEVLEDRLTHGTRRRKKLSAKFHGPWNGSVDPIYAEEAY